eukprot:scaffold18152_cov43-Prasinocladus_malaysianus.AAC.1
MVKCRCKPRGFCFMLFGVCWAATPQAGGKTGISELRWPALPPRRAANGTPGHPSQPPQSPGGPQAPPGAGTGP